MSDGRMRTNPDPEDVTLFFEGVYSCVHDDLD